MNDSSTFDNDQLHCVQRNALSDKISPEPIVRFVGLEVEQATSQSRRVLMKHLDDVAAGVSADAIEMNRQPAKAGKEAVTMVQPSTDNFTAEDRVVEHERSDARRHSPMFVFEILRILLVRFGPRRRQRE